MKKKDGKSLAKSIIMAIFFVAIILIYFNHITSTKSTSQKNNPDKTELQELLEYDMVSNYPNTPRDVAKLHCRYSKMIYSYNVSDKNLQTICDNMRALYSSELLQYNPESTALESMKDAIKTMEDEEYSYKAYSLPEASQVQYYTQDGKEMATLEVTLTMGTKDGAGYYYQQYVFVKENDKWKILTWGASQLNKSTTEESVE